MLDTRLVTRSYGRTIVSSLPEINIVHNVEDVKTFFDSIPTTKAQAARQKVDSADVKDVNIT